MDVLILAAYTGADRGFNAFVRFFYCLFFSFVKTKKMPASNKGRGFGGSFPCYNWTTALSGEGFSKQSFSVWVEVRGRGRKKQEEQHCTGCLTGLV